MSSHAMQQLGQNLLEPQKGPSLYELAGGRAAFFRLVTHFYQRVETDPILRPLYPADLTESIHWTALFLIQFCGGPSDYSQHRGHPRLRMRHLPFKIGKKERDAWVSHMQHALEAEIENPQVREFLTSYFGKTATFMINQHEEGDSLNIVA